MIRFYNTEIATQLGNNINAAIMLEVLRDQWRGAPQNRWILDWQIAAMTGMKLSDVRKAGIALLKNRLVAERSETQGGEIEFDKEYVIHRSYRMLDHVEIATKVTKL